MIDFFGGIDGIVKQFANGNAEEGCVLVNNFEAGAAGDALVIDDTERGHV